MGAGRAWRATAEEGMAETGEEDGLRHEGCLLQEHKFRSICGYAIHQGHKEEEDAPRTPETSRL